ncbi:MAG TPA: ATP-dependent zinc metalloprotease FtsH [Planctomycetota bacterium]|nr:ATP-dependent zinc metalloprotease FtsH [Planctomycetota bacterium]
MADTPSTPPEKNKKNRSFGAFLLFLTVLVAVLFIFRTEIGRNSKTLTQDQFEYYLVKGQVESQKMSGQNRITGRLKQMQRLGGDEFQDFAVDYASLGSNEQRLRDLKAVPTYQPIKTAELLDGIEQHVYEPKTARVLTSTYEPAVAAQPKGSAAPASGLARPTAQRTELLVSVFAPSKTEYAERQEKAQAGSSGDATRFPLPVSPGNFSLIVDDLKDVGSLVAVLEQHKVTPEFRSYDLVNDKGTQWSESSSVMQQALLFYAPWLIIFIVILFFMRQMRNQGGAGGVMSFGRSRAQLYTKEKHTNVTFDDVAGAQEAKDEVREVVEFLKNPTRFTKIGGRIPRGVLLVGPPGCGKTLLAKAIAGEAEVPFFSISGSDFVEMFVGVGASRVRDLFKQARENSPCIIFLDEIDAVGRRRGSGMGGGHDEREQTLNAILVEMDGFGTDEGIILIAATNRPDVLDPALLRPGRFDREVVIDLPDLEGREEILRVHLKKVKAAPDANPKVLARSTPGYSGADLAAIINEAAIRAALAKKEHIEMDDLEEARDKVRYGRQKRSRKLELEDRKITAYHEAGHAVIAALVPEVEAPHKVTIVPRGRSLGATMVLPEKESYHMQKKRMLGQLTLLFGGRVAEQEFCGDISAGASDDIKRATDLARAMVGELGMSAKIGPINYAERQGSDFLGTELMRGRMHSEETAREIDHEVHQILDTAYKRAEEILRGRREVVECIAQALLSYETINGDDVQRLMNGATVESLRPGLPPVAPGVGSGDGRKSPGASVSVPKPSAGELPGTPGLSPA